MRTSMHTRRVGIVILIGALAAGAALLRYDSHHTNAKYLVWRYTATGDWKREMRYLGVDRSFNESFIGQPRARLQRWFPDLRPGPTQADLCPNTPEYAPWREKRRTGEWIGTSPWLVTYDDKRNVRELLLAKGC
jgi:hypothetical protein